MQSLHSNGDSFKKGVAFAYLLLFIVYILTFVSFGVQFFTFEKKIRKPDKSFKTKYIIFPAVTLLLCVLSSVCIAHMWSPNESEYHINTLSNQYSVGIEYLDETITHEISLKAGNSLDSSFTISNGELKVSIYLDKENPIYVGTLKESISFDLDIHETGSYSIVVTGK